MTQPAITLVLLPGMDGSGALFADFIRALGDSVVPQVVSYPVDQALDYAGLTEFARARLPVDRSFVLVGESFSGPVAIALAASSPPGLAGLILSCTFARNPAPVFSRFKPLVGLLPIPAFATSLIAPFLLGASATDAMRRSLRAAVAQVPAAVMRQRISSVLEVDKSDLMRTVKMPILYLQAAQDRVVRPSAARLLAALAPQLQLVQIPGPHLLLQAAPAQAAHAVQQFLASLLQGPPRAS